MTATVHILLVDDDPTENIILGALMRKVASYAITLHYVETVNDALGFIRASGAPLS